jgi:hypothetical protein
MLPSRWMKVSRRRVPLVTFFLVGTILLLAPVIPMKDSSKTMIVLSPTSSEGTTTVSLQGNSSVEFKLLDISFQLPQSKSACQSQGQDEPCWSNAILSGNYYVNASSPLSSLYVSVNGVDNGGMEWNLVSPWFTHTYCSGGPGQNCTTIVSPNTNLLTTRNDSFSIDVPSGANGNPTFSAGENYSIVLVASFEDGSKATTSLSVMAVSASGMPANWYVLPLSLLVVSLAAVVLVVFLLRRRVASSSVSVTAPVKLT